MLSFDLFFLLNTLRLTSKHSSNCDRRLSVEGTVLVERLADTLDPHLLPCLTIS